jgi:hypothetical protein
MLLVMLFASFILICHLRSGLRSKSFAILSAIKLPVEAVSTTAGNDCLLIVTLTFMKSSNPEISVEL